MLGWPNLKEAGASDSDEYGFLPYILGNDTSDFANNGIQASASKQLMIDAEQSTPEQQEAAKAFVNWLVYSDNGQKMLVEDAAVIPACKNNTYEVLDPLGKDIQAKWQQETPIHPAISHLLTTGAYLELPCRNTLADSVQEMILQQTSTTTGHHRINRI